MNESSVVSGRSTRHGEVLAGRYLLGPILGRGGMADVYRATDCILQREVAVKILRQPGLAPLGRARFLAEARTLAALNHPGLVTLLDVHSGDDCTFLVMELVDGTPLSELGRTRPTNPLHVADIGRQLAATLAYVHDQGVIHRDIKPANVLIGSDEHVRLADFGIARVLGDLTRHTATGFTMGTATYVAPEQLLGTDVSGSADIYALGLLLMEQVSGVPAFNGTAAEIAGARLAGPPAIPSSVPGEWRPLLSDMTAVDPGERPPASEVHTRLDAMIGTTENPIAAETAVLNVQRTRPLTQPIPVVEPSNPATRDLGQAFGRYVTKWTSFSARGQLICLAVLIAVALTCVGVVVVSAGDGPTGDPAPNVPGKIGRHLKELHEAVYP